MISFKDSLKNNALCNQFKDCYIEEYSLNNETGKMMLDRTLNTATEESTRRVSPSKLNDDIVDINKEFMDLDYYFEYKTPMDWEKFGKTNIDFEFSHNTHSNYPFITYNDKEKDKVITYKPKSMSKLLKINIISSTESDEGDNKSTRRIYRDKISVGLFPDDKYTYIYIIAYNDASLPTVILTRDRLLKLTDTLHMIFDTNTGEKSYSSYFHPHTFSVEKVQNYPNSVFGRPGVEFDSLKFDETYSTPKFRYSNTDGISAEQDGNNIDVLISNYIFGYIDENNKVGINFLDKFKDIVNNVTEEFMESKKEEKMDVKYLTKQHPNFKDLLTKVLVNVSMLVQIENISDYTIYLFRDEQLNSIGALKIVEGVDKDDSVAELIYPIILSDGVPSIIYNIFTLDDHFYGYQYNGTPDKLRFDEYTSYTMNRTIAKSASGSMVLMDQGKYNYTIDNSGYIVSSNLPIDHVNIKNIFGF
jgi:hypothetical protein